MSTLPTNSSPPRHREMVWGEHPPQYSYDHDDSPSPYRRSHQGGGMPGGYGPPPPHPPPPHVQPSPRGPPPNGEYWQHESRGGGGMGWNGPPPPPPPHHEGYSPHERAMQPPPRAARSHPPAFAYRPGSVYRHDDPYYSYSPKFPSPARGGYPSRPPSHMPNGREFHQGPSPGGYPPENPSPARDKKGDPLSILANVSAGMTSKDGQQKRVAKDTHQQVPMPAPTSPLQRRNRPSPITPSQTPPETKHRNLPRHQVTPTSNNRQDMLFSGWERHGETAPEFQPHFPRRRRPGHAYGEQGSAAGRVDSHPPALVEKGSFDSQNESYMPVSESHYPPNTPHPNEYYYEEPPSPHSGHWENAPYPPNSPYPPPPNSPYPPPRWNYGPPMEHFPPPPPPEYGYEKHQEAAYPPHRPFRPPPPAPHASPYTYVQQPRLEEKTILRKKFSWKHYPELERFLIANRDEYLKHSNMNYTAEQKQYNNWLTERLLEVAERHHYVFDPNDFNFVAIRDRIRCYYKSYVQTARKRGLKLPEKKK